MTETTLYLLTSPGGDVKSEDKRQLSSPSVTQNSHHPPVVLLANGPAPTVSCTIYTEIDHNQSSIRFSLQILIKNF